MSFVSAFFCSFNILITYSDHLSGKPGNVREFDSCQGNVRDFTASQGNVREKISSGKRCVKLFIFSCIFAFRTGILVGVYSALIVKYGFGS